MRSFTTILATIATFTTMSFTAFAADLGHAPSAQKGTYVTSGTESPWSGAYAGIHGGWAWTDFDSLISVPDGVDVASDSLVAKLGSEDWLLGAQFGVQRQVGNLVFGIEADASWMDHSGSKSVGLLNADGDPILGNALDGDGNQLMLDHVTSIEWLGTLRARVGYPSGRFMPYITGGLAIADTDSSVGVQWNAVEKVDDVNSLVGHSATLLTPDDIKLGWTVGGGIEVDLGSGYSLGAEYLYVDLGDSAVRAVVDDETVEYNTKTQLDIVRAKLNYRF